MFGPEFPRTGKEVLSQIHGEKCWPNVAKVSPCEDACPIHTDVPSYVMAIAQGRFKEALGVIRETNPFPSVCARVCHHPCEDACNRKFVDEPIAIQFLKRVAANEAGSAEDVPEPAKKRKERVAVAGSGPAGLTQRTAWRARATASPCTKRSQWPAGCWHTGYLTSCCRAKR